jgi:glycosyltransferase involved in cell wall biosynthesis
MNNSLVSIIVPCYNQAHFLNESLISVLEQTYNNWECIIVNDGSPDNTESVAKIWLNKDNRFKYIYKENGGLSGARNSGIKISRGDYILPLDADDILDKSFLKRLLPELEKNKSLGLVTCFSKFFLNNKENIIHELKPVGTTYHAILFENSIIATSLYRKSCWELVGGYDEKMKHGFEDWEFWIAITKQGWTYKVVEEFLFYYRKSKKSMLIDTLENHRISNLDYVINKHKDVYINHFDNTKEYFFFLINLYRNNEKKLKSSLEYRIGKMITKPFKMFKNLISSKQR